MVKIEFNEKFGHLPLWTNSMYSGMPAYQISVEYPANLIKHVNAILFLWHTLFLQSDPTICNKSIL